jgi:hypothetical protein
MKVRIQRLEEHGGLSEERERLPTRARLGRCLQSASEGLNNLTDRIEMGLAGADGNRTRRLQLD